MRLYFDANALIQAVEKSGYEAESFGAVLEKAARSKVPLISITSVLTLAELLVKPIQTGDLALVEVYNNLLVGGGEQITTAQVTPDILRAAARLRANHRSLKLPDAIHLATAELLGCTHILSGDKRLAGYTALPVWNPVGADLAAFIEMMS